MSGRTREYETLISVRWRLLLRASKLMEQGRTSEASVLYHRSHNLKDSVLSMYADNEAPSGYLITDALDLKSPSLNGAVWLYFPHFTQLKTWHYWFKWFAPLAPHMDTLPYTWQARLHVAETLAYATQRWGYDDAGDFIDRSTRYLNDLQLEPLVRSLNHLAMAMFSRVIRDDDRALHHIHLAEQHLPKGQQFWLNMITDNLGATYYYLNDQGKNYFAVGSRYYDRARELAIETNNGYDYSLGAYNQGWVYVETHDLNAALDSFDAGLSALIDERNDITSSTRDEQLYLYDEALYYYGKGYTLYALGDILGAHEMLKDAYAIFSDSTSLTYSLLMMGICQFVLAQIYASYGDFDHADPIAEAAIVTLEQTYHPVQVMHAYHTRFLVHLRARRWRAAWQAYLVLREKRRAANKPLFAWWWITDWLRQQIISLRG